jgi:hypothetical protein
MSLHLCACLGLAHHKGLTAVSRGVKPFVNTIVAAQKQER